MITGLELVVYSCSDFLLTFFFISYSLWSLLFSNTQVTVEVPVLFWLNDFWVELCPLNVILWLKLSVVIDFFQTSFTILTWYLICSYIFIARWVLYFSSNFVKHLMISDLVMSLELVYFKQILCVQTFLDFYAWQSDSQFLKTGSYYLISTNYKNLQIVTPIGSH